MIIRNVEVTPYKVPNAKSCTWAAGVLAAAEHLIVKIESEDGTYGVAEAIPRPMIYGETQEGMFFAIKKYLAPLLIGEDSFSIERIWEKMNTVVWNPAAKGAIDVALHDLNGKLLNLPVYKMFGGPYRQEVNLSWQIAFGKNEEMLEELKCKIKEGYRTFKVKGGPDPDNDIKILKLMRENSPDDVRLYIDANMAYNRQDAYRVMKALEGVLCSLEEPLQAWDNEGRKELAQKGDIPILSDESTFTYADVYHQVQLGAIGQIGIKIPRTGFTISRKIVHLAEIANLPVQISLQAETDLGTAACLQFAAAFRQISLPCELTYFLEISDRLLKNELIIKNGAMLISDKPGIGAEVDWDKVRSYAVEI
ncbi:MAG: mandelate racemase/muconate lactonizing enzyme family protein [Desulfosporosinus sp.]|nr:mandelate racemase/muconate lactonizing enzyme family protein [Desulfosporosinus sp.]